MENLEQTFGNGIVQDAAADVQTRACCEALAPEPVAFIGGIYAAVALVADGEPPAAVAAKQHSLQECQAFSRRTGQDVLLGTCQVTKQGRLIFEELLPSDVSLVVVRNCNSPGRHWHSGDFGLNLAFAGDLFAAAKASKSIDAGVGWIFQNRPNSTLG